MIIYLIVWWVIFFVAIVFSFLTLEIEEDKENNVWQDVSINTIYNMDCIEGMKLIPDWSIDCLGWSLLSPDHCIGSIHCTIPVNFSSIGMI